VSSKPVKAREPRVPPITVDGQDGQYILVPIQRVQPELIQEFTELAELHGWPLVPYKARGSWYPRYRIPRTMVHNHHSVSGTGNVTLAGHLVARNGVLSVQNHEMARVVDLDELTAIMMLHPKHLVRDLAARLTGYRYSLGPNITTFINVLVRGVHVGKPVEKLPESITRIDVPDHGPILVIRGVKRRGLVLGLVKEGVNPNAILDRADLTESSYTEQWCARIAANTQKRLGDNMKQMIQLRNRMHTLAAQQGSMVAMLDILKAGGVQYMKRMQEGLIRAGFDSVRFSLRGIVARSKPLFITLGSHEDERNHRYIGTFEFTIGLNGDVEMRNVAAPSRSSRIHPVLSHDHPCLGNYHDTLVNCLLTSDMFTFGCTLLACVTHFDPSHVSRDALALLPTKQPDEVYPVSEPIMLLGSMDDATTDASGDDDDQED
jgi:hypothetical protein